MLSASRCPVGAASLAQLGAALLIAAPAAAQPGVSLPAPTAVPGTTPGIIAAGAPRLDASVEVGWRRWSSASWQLDAPVTAGELRTGWRWLQLRGRGTLPLAPARQRWSEGELSAALHAPLPRALDARGLRLELAAGGARAPFGAMDSSRTVQVHAQAGGAARLWLERRWGGAWVGAGRAVPWGASELPSVNEATLGGWTQLGGVTLTAALRHRAGSRVDRYRSLGIDSSGAGGTTSHACRSSAGAAQPGTMSCTRSLAATDVDVGARWHLRGVALQAAAGARVSASVPGPEPIPGFVLTHAPGATLRERAWASASAVVPVASRLSVVVAAARAPSDAVRGLPGRRTLSLGLRFAPAPPLLARVPRAVASAAAAAEEGEGVAERAVVAPAAADGRHPVRFVLPGAQQVELRGDMTDWEPVALRSRDGRLWHHDGALRPGVYHFSIRVDGGEWRPLAGAPATSDGFGGSVSVLVVGS